MKSIFEFEFKGVKIPVELSELGIEKAAKEFEAIMLERRKSEPEDDMFAELEKLPENEPLAGEGREIFSLKVQIYLEEYYPGIYFSIYPIQYEQFILQEARGKEYLGGAHRL